MYLRCNRRNKDGKEHRYWNIVESKRCAGGKVVQRQVLYLGEINDGQQQAWCRVIEAFDEKTQQKTQLALFPAEKELPDHAVMEFRFALRRWSFIGRASMGRAGWPVISMNNWRWISSGKIVCPIVERGPVGAMFFRRWSVTG